MFLLESLLVFLLANLPASQVETPLGNPRLSQHEYPLDSRRSFHLVSHRGNLQGFRQVNHQVNHLPNQPVSHQGDQLGNQRASPLVFLQDNRVEIRVRFLRVNLLGALLVSRLEFQQDPLVNQQGFLPVFQVVSQPCAPLGSPVDSPHEFRLASPPVNQLVFLQVSQLVFLQVSRAVIQLVSRLVSLPLCPVLLLLRFQQCQPDNLLASLQRFQLDSPL